MRTLGRLKTVGIIAIRLILGLPAALLVLTTPSRADSVVDFHATFVEPAGGQATQPMRPIWSHHVALPGAEHPDAPAQ